jgi:hypothetical protein
MVVTAIRKILSGQVQRQADGQPSFGGDLMTVGRTAPPIRVEWKISPAGNGGSV